MRLVRWFDSRLGLSYPLLRPVPQYSINPFYWLGALTVVAFVIQGITGVIMMLYYVPSPTQAWSSTSFIFQNVSYGRFLETIHLYTAYAMIMLAFMHMMRGYFVSVHKKPREVMWIVGMIMGFVTPAFQIPVLRFHGLRACTSLLQEAQAKQLEELRHASRRI